MELALSLGNRGVIKSSSGVNFCMGLTPSSSRSTADINLSGDHDHHHHKMMITNGGGDDDVDGDDDDEIKKMEKIGSSSSCDPTAVISPRQLDLLPLSPVPRTLTTLPSPPLRFPWLSENLSSEPGSSDGPGQRTMEVDRRQTTMTVVGATAEDGDAQSSPNSGTSSFMEFSLYTNSNNNCKRSNGNVEGAIVVRGGGEQVERGGTTSRGSDDEENGCSTRKKLRLSKEQSAFLEESFKEHHTLNPKQKQALAKELNLRPRQVEVWFQNRRARTKLKQTEVDCEYLKRCCETLTEENRRLQKELHDLRALKTSQPFFMQLPATTLTMCPSCERVAPTSSSAAAAAHKPVSSSVGPSAAISSGNDDDDDHDDNGTTLSLGKPSSNNNNSNVPFSSNTPTKTC